ncbi:hypothetical protein ABZP36_030640 [Zizania latifolia]
MAIVVNVNGIGIDGFCLMHAGFGEGLTVLDFLVAHGTERVIDDIREHSYQISSLADFQYIDSCGRDQGTRVHLPPAEHTGSGGYGGGYDNDRYEGSYGSRYDNRNGYGGEREYGYRDDDRYGGIRDLFQEKPGHFELAQRLTDNSQSGARCRNATKKYLCNADAEVQEARKDF